MTTRGIVCILFIGMLSVLKLSAQRKITVEEAVQLSLKYQPQIKSATLEAERYGYLQKSSINIPNPEILMESTTGDYQTLGFLQSFDFPTVYAKQHAVARQQTEMSKLAASMTTAQVATQTRLAYLDLQYYSYLQERLTERDSLYTTMALAAKRKFDVGEADALAVSYAELQRMEVARQLAQATADYDFALRTLQLYTGSQDLLETDNISEQSTYALFASDSIAVQGSVFMKYAHEKNALSEKQLSVERNKALPGLVVGYLNQADSNTPFDMRVRAGITVPLWWWQYSGNIKAAKKQVEITQQESVLREQELFIRVSRLLNDYRKYKSTLNYFEQNGLQLSQTMIQNSSRFFEAGVIDYVSHLRNMNDAYQQQNIYIETLWNLNKTVIELNYITTK